MELIIFFRNITSKHFDISEDIRAEIRSARENRNRQRIISWLSKGVPDPSEEHNVARAKHEATTGSWFIESDDFKTWHSAPNSFLWLNGGGMLKFEIKGDLGGKLANKTVQPERANLFYGEFTLY
jgi:hypothetical protein